MNWGYILLGVLVIALFLAYKLMDWFDEDETDYLG